MQNTKIKIKKFFINKSTKCLKINYSFVSLYPPHKIGKVSLTNFIQDDSFNNRKILIKQSYLLATWFTYLLKFSFSEAKSSNVSRSKYKASLFIQPLRTHKVTMTKAPMAHKTFSQEQFKIEFYKITLSCPLKPVKHSVATLPNINQTLFIYLSLKKSLFFFGTNVFFLKKIGFSLLTYDSSFFSIK